MGAHQKQSRNQLRRQQELRKKSDERYNGKLDLARTYEELGLEVPFELADRVRRLKTLQENKGAL